MCHPEVGLVCGQPPVSPPQPSVLLLPSARRLDHSFPSQGGTAGSRPVVFGEWPGLAHVAYGQPPLQFPPLATIGAPGSQPESASHGRGNGGLHAEDDSVREMRKSKGLIKTLKLVPNEVSHRSALEGSQALSSERCLFPNRVPATPRVPPPTHPAFGGQMVLEHQC